MSSDLQRQDELADALIHKLKTIQELWEQLPDLDELDKLALTAGGLANSLQQAYNLYTDDDFPTVDDLADLAKEAGHLAGHLQQASNATGEEGKNRVEPSRPVPSHQLL